MPVEGQSSGGERVNCALYPATELPPKELLNRLTQLSTSLIADALPLGAGVAALRPVAGLSCGSVVAGPALTVRTQPGDNLVVHKSLDIARRGEVLVVSAGGATDRAIIGGLIGQYAALKGLAAVVVDGAVRDLCELQAAAVPVFAAGVTPRGPSKEKSGELRGPVTVAGLTIHDGDLVIGDEDGIVVVPRLHLDAVIFAAEAIRDADASASREIAAGAWERPWVDARLQIVPSAANAGSGDTASGDAADASGSGSPVICWTSNIVHSGGS